MKVCFGSQVWRFQPLPGWPAASVGRKHLMASMWQNRTAHFMGARKTHKGLWSSWKHVPSGLTSSHEAPPSPNRAKLGPKPSAHRPQGQWGSNVLQQALAATCLHRQHCSSQLWVSSGLHGMDTCFLLNTFRFADKRFPQKYGE